jgi:hypothetical protein
MVAAMQCEQPFQAVSPLVGSPAQGYRIKEKGMRNSLLSSSFLQGYCSKSLLDGTLDFKEQEVLQQALRLFARRGV